MVNILDTLATIIVIIIWWLISLWIVMSNIKSSAKKKCRNNDEMYKKIEKKYPYFNYPFIKKIFFLGLKGCITRAEVVLAFICNIALFLNIISGIVTMITPNLYISYIFRATLGIVFLIAPLKLFIQSRFPPRF